MKGVLSVFLWGGWGWDHISNDSWGLEEVINRGFDPRKHKGNACGKQWL